MFGFRGCEYSGMKGEVIEIIRAVLLKPVAGFIGI
jgi:hypothetical protein